MLTATVLAAFDIPLFVLVRRGFRDGWKGLKRGADPTEETNGGDGGDGPTPPPSAPPQLPGPVGTRPALPRPEVPDPCAVSFRCCCWPRAPVRPWRRSTSGRRARCRRPGRWATPI
ncbi:hypothetical protein AB5I41_31805 [Sphingomonas sp. MMS24-JH45]